MAYKIRGIDDSINTCDCCGKTGLKSTVIVESEDGEMFHYGSVCASRHTKYTSKEINKALGEIRAVEDAALKERMKHARDEWSRDMDNIRHQAAILQAHKAGLVGKPFRESLGDLPQIARKREQEIIEKYSLNCSSL